MNQQLGDGTRYGEQEIGAILRRAGEIQRGESQSSAPQPRGLTLNELERVAAELGIAPEHIRAAVGSLDEAENVQVGWLSGPKELRVVRVIEGSVDDAAWESMVAAVRGVFNQAGEVSIRPTAREWMSEQDGGYTRLSAIETQGHTRIELVSNFGHSHFGIRFGSIFPPTLLGLLATVALATSHAAPPWLSVLPPLAMFAIGTGVSRTVIQAWIKKEQARIRSLADRLCDTARVLSEQPGVTAELPATEQAPTSDVASQRVRVAAGG